MKIISVFTLTFILLTLAAVASAADYEIMDIEPVFNKATTGFGDFAVKVGIKSNMSKKSEISVACLYTGLSHAGVYYKNEPRITEEYKQVLIKPFGQIHITFDKDFRSYHPETKGELIISIVGTGIVRSYPLKTRFHPENED